MKKWNHRDNSRLEAALLALGRGEHTETGEPAGLSELYDLMAQAMYATAYVITGHREDAEDVLQDTLIEIVQDAYRYRSHTNPRAWVLTVTRHTALDAVRRRQRRQTMPLDEAIEATIAAPADAEEEFAALWDMLSVLDGEERDVILLRLYHGLPYAEVSDILHISIAAAQKRYQRAIGKLRRYHGATAHASHKAEPSTSTPQKEEDT